MARTYRRKKVKAEKDWGVNSYLESRGIPWYYDRNDILWIEKLDEWLLDKGWEYEYVGEHLFNDEYYLVSGNTIRNIKHVCIYKNGKLFHDPHPSQQGLISETSIHTLRKINYND